jgi:two-component system NtrC family sensor kinase
MMPADSLLLRSIDWTAVRQVFDIIPVRVALLNREHRYLYVNREWSRFFGKPKDIVLGATIAEVLDEEHLADVRPWAERALAGAVAESDGWIELPWGRRYVRRTFAPMCDAAGAIEAYFVFSSDLTDLRLTEQNLVEQSAARNASEALSAAIVAVATDCIITIDGTGRIVEFNPAAERTFGHRRADVLGRPIAASIVPPHLRRSDAHGFESFLAPGECLAMGRWIEIEAIRADGTIFPAELTVTEVHLPGRHLFTAYMRDLTAAREAEAEIQRQRSALQQSEMMKVAILGQLVVGIAHEINTPVGNALAASSQTREETALLETLFATGKLRRGELEGYLATIKKLSDILMRNCQRAGQLIRDFKQVAADQTSGQRRRFDLADQLRETLRTLQHRFDRAKVPLVTDLPANILMDSVPGALSQIVINLAENALVHAFPTDTGGSLTVSAKQIAQDRVEISVADDGKGITQEVLPKIFDPFFTTNRGAGNTGLGLHIVHNLVTGPLGGTIQVKSAIGGGTQFVLRLPLASPAPATSVSRDEISRLLDPPSGSASAVAAVEREKA